MLAYMIGNPPPIAEDLNLRSRLRYKEYRISRGDYERVADELERMRNADVVVMLDGWEDSCEAIVEAAYAQLLKLPVLDPDTLEVSDRGITVEAGYTLLPEDM